MAKPIPAFLPGESHGQRSPEGCSPWGRKELDTGLKVTEHAHTHREKKNLSFLFTWIIYCTLNYILFMGTIDTQID